MLLNERKFNIKEIKMTEEMRTSILDEVRWVIEQEMADSQSSHHLKRKIQEKYGGKWQVMIGKQMFIFFDPVVIKDYIELVTESKVMIIFRKSQALEEPATSSVQIEK